MKTTGPTKREPAWAGIGKFLFVAVLTVLFFLLGHSMVQHRFHEGNRRHHNGSLGQ